MEKVFVSYLILFFVCIMVYIVSTIFSSQFISSLYNKCEWIYNNDKLYKILDWSIFIPVINTIITAIGCVFVIIEIIKESILIYKKR